MTVPDSKEQQIQRLIEACRQNLPVLAQSLNRCFDSRCRLLLGNPSHWSAEFAEDALAGGGLVVPLVMNQRTLVCLIPASLPLPAWYAEPSEGQSVRLQTLAMEWAALLVPNDVAEQCFEPYAVEDLQKEAVRWQPDDGTMLLELSVTAGPSDDGGEAGDGDAASSDDASSDDASSVDASSVDADEGNEAEANQAAEAAKSSGTAVLPVSRLFLLGPVLNPAENIVGARAAASRSLESETGPAAEDIVESAAETPGSPAAPITPTGGGTETRPESRPANLGARSRAAWGRARLLAELPVTVSVSLAEKKIELSQLLSLTPGALIIFNKSCEDLLDLYVNNQKYCKGEAVKIGEKFGLKVNKVGVQEVRAERVLNT